MRNRGRWRLAAFAALAGPIVGCGGSDTSGSSSGSPKPNPEPVIQIVVDANRNGQLDYDDPTELANKNDWTADHGASFLANLDDDDKDGKRDVDDEIINGDADLEDLARIGIAPWPNAPDGVTGIFTLDDASAAQVRIWKQGLDTQWTLVAGSLGPCDTPTASCMQVTSVTLTADEVRKGIVFGIEGRFFKRSSADGSWTGMVDLSYAVHDKADQPFTTTALADGIDHAKMRIAPWMLNGNLSPFDRVWSDSFSTVFVNGIQTATMAAGLTYKRYSTWDDQWTQDFFQTGWTAIPGPNGTLHGMKFANARPWGRDAGDQWLPINWLMKNYLGPDQGVGFFYKPEDVNQGSTFDSHGNHDLIPPYTNGSSNYPMGRIFTGSGVLPETWAFYDAQGPQSPHFQVKTDWLDVGHIDEMFSYVPAKTARGWKLLVGTPKLAVTMLTQAQMAGNGSVTMFTGKQEYASPTSYQLVDATVSIDAVLANADLMQWSQQAQTEIDSDLMTFKAEVGLADDEVIQMPYLFEMATDGLVAYQPGTANLLAFGDYVVIANPFGPVINGADLFMKDLQDRLGTPVNNLGHDGQGLKVNFTDDWSGYHILEGEVHCGSNPDAPPPAGSKWWETGR